MRSNGRGQSRSRRSICMQNKSWCVAGLHVHFQSNSKTTLLRLAATGSVGRESEELPCPKAGRGSEEIKHIASGGCQRVRMLSFVALAAVAFASAAVVRRQTVYLSFERKFNIFRRQRQPVPRPPRCGRLRAVGAAAQCAASSNAPDA